MAVRLAEDKLNYWFRSALYQQYWDLRHKAEQTQNEKKAKKIRENARTFHRIADKAEASRSNITNVWEKALAYEGLLKYMDFIHTEAYQIYYKGEALEAELAMDQLMPEYYDYYNAILLFRAAAEEMAWPVEIRRKKQVYNDLIWAKECLNIQRDKLSIRRMDIVSEVANYAIDWEMAEALGISRDEFDRCCDVLEQIEADYTISWEERISRKQK